MLRRMATGGLHFAFKAWLRSTQDAKELEKRWASGGLQISTVLRRLCASVTLSAWMKWKEVNARYREQRRILKRASQLMADVGKRLMNRELARGWRAWNAAVAEAKARAESMKSNMRLFMRTLQGKADLKVSHAWHMLVRNTDIIAFQADMSWDQKLLQEKSLKRTAKAVANSSLRKGWNTWRTQLATQKLARLKLGTARRTFHRLTVLSLSVAWNTWASFMLQVASEKLVMSRVMRRVLRLQQAVAWQAWDCALQELREDERTAAARASSMRKIAKGIANSALRKALNTWREKTHSHRLALFKLGQKLEEQKRVMSRVIGRALRLWQAMSWGAWDCALEVLREEERAAAAAGSSMRRIAKGMANSALRKALNSWFNSTRRLSESQLVESLVSRAKANHTALEAANKRIEELEAELRTLRTAKALQSSFGVASKTKAIFALRGLARAFNTLKEVSASS